jgi:hypothetical protein
MDFAAVFNAQARAQGWPFSCDARLVFLSPELHALHALWLKKARMNSVPTRGDFEARDLKPFLRNIAIFERVLNGYGTWRHRTRFFGSVLAQRVGELTDQNLEDVASKKYTPALIACIDAALATGTPLRFVARPDAPELSHLVAESILCPLRGQGDASVLILSATYVAPREELGLSARKWQ